MLVKYVSYKVKIIIMALVLLSVVNTASAQINHDFIKKLSDFIQKMFKTEFNFERFFYILVGIFAIMIILNRNTWLPFLGPSVLPSALVPLKQNSGDTIIKVKVRPNAKVAYWAALPPKKDNSKDPSVSEAYGDYSNSGVVQADDKGIALLTISKSTGYYVPMGRHLSQHVHYRELSDNWGMMGSVQTKYY